MDLPRTRQAAPRVEWREHVGSTNDELKDLALAADPPHGTVVITADQRAGRGRAGRDWSTPPGEALAMSVLIRDFGAARLGLGWLPLIAGSAVSVALQPFFRDAVEDDWGEPMSRRVCVKWPNDVHLRSEADAAVDSPGLKLCGILCELLPDGSAIVGMGINLLLPEENLPTDRSTSLVAAGADVGEAMFVSSLDPAGAELGDTVAASVVAELLRLTALAHEQPQVVRTRVLRDSATLGAQVRVHLPDGRVVDGRARGLAADGSLEVDRPTGGRLTVSAGDVEHLR